MIRNLKVLLGAAMVLAAFGAFTASGAQANAAASTFHCHVEPCAVTLEKNGTGTTAHHVFVIKNHIGESLSITCNEVTGFATSNTKTTDTLTFTNLAYDHCTVVGQPATVNMNSCHYDIKANGTVTIQCEAGKVISIALASGCIFTVGSQGPLSGLKFHAKGSTATPPAASNTHVTVEAKVPGIAVSAHGTLPQCGIDVTKTLTGEYTTGNTTVTGFNDPAGTPADQHGGTRADIWWTTGALG